MNNKQLLLATVAGFIVSTAAYGQVELTITGSSAFRSIVRDRTYNLLRTTDLANYSAVTNSDSAGTVTYRGRVPSLPGTPVTIRFYFSGSGKGMLDVLNQALIPTVEGPANSDMTNKVADVAFSDAFPSSATPPISESAFDRYVVGVVPFAYVANNGLAGVTNITRDQAVLLMTASGNTGLPGMPATYLGGTSTDPVYMIGRDSGSGTRIVTEKCIGFSGSPLLWATNAAGQYVVSAGYSSGSNVRALLNGKTDAIGYLGLADYAAISANAKALSYNGVPYSSANVANGSYALWGYVHLVHRAGGLSANQLALFTDLKNAIVDPVYQSTSPTYTNAFVNVSGMRVQRGADGGVITSLDF
jgi:hypothetical protein